MTTPTTPGATRPEATSTTGSGTTSDTTSGTTNDTAGHPANDTANDTAGHPTNDTTNDTANGGADVAGTAARAHDEIAGEVAKVAKLASGIRIGMLTTRGPDGTLVSRPMAQQEVEFDGDLWFFAERDSRKVAHLTADPTAAVTLTSNDTWISLFGSARVVDDDAKARQLWNQWVAAWLPQGPDDPSVVLVKFTAESAEYWDTPGGRLASAVSFVKAKVTGERYDGGDHGVVTL